MKNKVNEIQVSYKENLKASLSIKCSSDANKIVYNHWNQNTIGLHESFKIMLLNNYNKVKGIYELSNGGITGTLVDVRILFAIALTHIAANVV